MRRMSCVAVILVGLVTVSLAGVGVALDKDATYVELVSLGEQIKSMKAQDGSSATALASLQSQYESLSALLGGDDPAALIGGGGDVAGPQRVAPQAPPNCTSTTLSFTDPTTVAIVDNTTVQGSVAVAGLGNYVMDVDLTVNITHTWSGDLDIMLTSPGGTTVVVTTDNGGGNDDVFNGTLFDDQALVPATDATYSNGVTASPLAPEGAFGAFIGEDPNGIWTLDIGDDAGGDQGTSSGFTLTITTLAAAPTTVAAGPFVQMTPVATVDLGTAQSTVNVSGAGTYLTDLDATTFITHTWSSDLIVELTSPQGTTVVLTSGNGGSNDDVYNGTVFDDSATNPISDSVFSDGVPTTPAQPEGALAAFIGENPNGTWTLDVSDAAAGDNGSVNSWSLAVTTGSCAVQQQPAIPTMSTVGMWAFALLLVIGAWVLIRRSV